MSTEEDHAAILREAAKQAKFNNWLGFQVVSASKGQVELRLDWREELGQYSASLHVGVIGALIDTACGFAAYTLVGPILGSHFSIRCLRPAVARAFVARGRVIKAGSKQVFASAEIAAAETPNKPFALADAILVPTET